MEKATIQDHECDDNQATVTIAKMHFVAKYDYIGQLQISSPVAHIFIMIVVMDLITETEDKAE